MKRSIAKKISEIKKIFFSDLLGDQEETSNFVKYIYFHSDEAHILRKYSRSIVQEGLLCRFLIWAV